MCYGPIFVWSLRVMKALLDHFDGVVDLPVEIDDIVQAIVGLGFQDEVHLFPVQADPSEFRGVIRQFRYNPGVYAEPRSVTHVVYTTQVPMDWQRVICAKELVHIFDRTVKKTDTPEEVSELIEKILGPLSTEDYGFADLQAAADRLALYQCLPLLFPTAALEQAKRAVHSGKVTEEQVAEAAVLPIGFVRLMLSSDWEKLNGFLCDK